MRIALASDHAGFQLKEVLRVSLAEWGYQVRDFGTHDPNPTDDYPDFAVSVCRAVTAGECERGILVCGTGIGSSIAANKVQGIRAALCHDTYSAQQSRCHNDANVLCLGERVIGTELAKRIVRIWLEVEFSGVERHRQRLAKIRAIEERDGARTDVDRH